MLNPYLGILQIQNLLRYGILNRKIIETRDNLQPCTTKITQQLKQKDKMTGTKRMTGFWQYQLSKSEIPFNAAEKV